MFLKKTISEKKKKIVLFKLNIILSLGVKKKENELIIMKVK